MQVTHVLEAHLYACLDFKLCDLATRQHSCRVRMCFASRLFRADPLRAVLLHQKAVLSHHAECKVLPALRARYSGCTCVSSVTIPQSSQTLEGFAE